MSTVRGGLQMLLRVEGLAVLTLTLLLYAYYGVGWVWFAVLILAPDLSMLGYLAGPRAGAATYNTVHTYVGPVLIWVGGAFLESRATTALALIWAAHIGLDRALGYGLKYATGFGHTHLGALGPKRSAPAS